MSPGGAILIRTDANERIGSGHIMRCLALAQAWRAAGHRAAFIIASDRSWIEPWLESEGFGAFYLSVEPGGTDDRKQTKAIAKNESADWVVLDGYYFGHDFQNDIKSTGSSVLFIDDYGHADHYSADIILNQNIYADQDLYKNRDSHVQLLLGTHYVLLRTEFLNWDKYKREIPNVADKILVTLGGSDINNCTGKVIEALGNVMGSEMEAQVLVGPSNANYTKLRSQIEGLSSLISLETHVTNMPEKMAWADMIISGSGTTTWELSFMGLAGLVIIMADNQIDIAKEVDRVGLAVNLGWANDLSPKAIGENLKELIRDPNKRSEMSSIGRQLVDGLGARRVVVAMDSRETLSLRRVTQADCHLVWRWANDPQVRAASFSSDNIALDEHVKWFENKLNDDGYLGLIAIDRNNEPIGQVRFDPKDDQTIIDISIDKKHRGLGYGTKVLSLAVKEFFDKTDFSIVHAYVKTGNVVSLAAFKKAGFEVENDEFIEGCAAVHLVLSKAD